MEKMLPWLAGLFKVEVIWLEKEDGSWVKRRRYHPVMRVLMLVCVLFLAVSLGLAFFSSDKTQAQEAETTAEVLVPPRETEFSMIRMTEFPRGVQPGPIPPGLRVADDEYWLRIRKSDYRLYLYRGLHVEKFYKVAVGRNSGDKLRDGDNRTPNGVFTVQSIENSRSWTYDFRDGKGPIRGAYGPWFIRLRTGWRGIGIHGTHNPDSLGTMASEGCVRMHNDELEELKQIARINMKVVIEE